MESLPHFFIELTLRGLAVLIVAGVASLALRRARPAVRHAVWTAAVAGMLLLPLLQTGIPGWTFPVWVERTANVPQSADVMDPQVVNVTATVPAEPGRPPARPVNGYAVLLGIYLAGASALLIRQAWSSLTLRRLLDRAPSVDVEGLASAAQAVGFTGRLPEVRESRDVRVPFTYGVSAPVIVLPDDWREWSDPKRLAVLAHETAHVARRDWLTGRIAAVNRAVNWWNPAAWWLERHLAALAEEPVDEAALAAVGDVKHYASAVVDFAIAMQGQRLGSMEATAMARSTKVGRRVERILASQGAGASGLKRGVFVTVAAVAAPLILVAASALPEVRQVGPNEPLIAAIQAPSAPEVRQQISANLPAGTIQEAAGPAAGETTAELEALMARDPNQVEVRGKLLNQYLAAGETEKARQQAWWLIENAPATRESSSASIWMMMPGRGLLRDDSDLARVREVWRQHVQKYPTMPMVLAAASQVAVMSLDYFEAEELMIRARKLEPDNRGYLGQLALMYVAALEPTGRMNPNAPQTIAFRAKAVSELETTTDANLVGLAGEMLTAGQVIMAAGKTAEEEAALRARYKARNELATKYLKRALSLDPENSRWRVALERASGEPQVVRMPEAAPGVKRITVGGNVQRARLKHEVRPEYPPLAKQARIQGSVRFSLIIATDGTVKNITLLSGHPLLVQPATEAVKQWVFGQTLLNGEPVEVISEAEVRFQPLEPLAQPVMEGNAYRIGGGIGVGGGGDGRAEAMGTAHRIGGGVSAPVPISKVEPVFPKGVDPEVKNALVLLAIIIGKEGSVTSVEPLRGDPAFFENAIETVKQWKFQPGMKEGEPVPVQARVEVNFRKF